MVFLFEDSQNNSNINEYRPLEDYSSSDIQLRVQNLHKYYEHVRAVDGISFSIKKGEIYGLL